MNACVTDGCTNPKTPGRGQRYCDPCRAKAAETQRRKAVQQTRQWRQNNPDRYREWNRQYYESTAETQRAKSRAWHHANFGSERYEARRAAQRAKRLPRVGKYGLTVDEYRDLLAVQGGGCAICGRTENGARHNFDVDHDHDTGEVRGLLCNRCNRLLSNALDDIEILTKAAAYLTRNEVSR